MMNQLYDIYCDESCHLEHDGEKAMVLGGIWCIDSIRKRIARDIRNLKVKYGLNPRYEMKWNKISKGKLEFYIKVVEYFFPMRIYTSEEWSFQIKVCFAMQILVRHMMIFITSAISV